MFFFLLSLHSLVRWLVLGSLLLSLYTAYRGIYSKSIFTSVANTLRHSTATMAHIQLMIGITIYFQSPVVQSVAITGGEGPVSERSFFRYLHISLMLLSIVLITIGSAKAKRMASDMEKYRTMFRWFIAALFIIFLAIPWPFYGYLSRPLLRTF